MIPHPRTMQVVNDQRGQELHARIARERLGMMTPLAAVNEERLPDPTRRRAMVTYGTAWSRTLVSATFMLRAIPRTSRQG